MPSQAITLLEKLTGWRLNAVIIILTIGLTDLVVAVVDWLLLGRIGPDSMMVSTVSGLIIATLVVSAAGSVRARIAKAHLRNLEQGTNRAKSHLRLAIETSRMLVWELDLLTGQMQYDHANLSLLSLATDTKADNISDWLALIHPDDRASFQRRFQETLIPGAPAFELDYRLQQAPGDWQWVNTLGQVTLRDAQGAPLVAVGGTININQRKQTELALQESKERLEAIFNYNPELMLISRLLDGHITEVNEAFIRRSGFSREQAIGNTTLGLGLWVHTQDRQRMTDALSAKGRCDDLETVFYDHTGQGVECALDAVVTNVGGVPHIVCTVRDISQRKRAEAERQASETLLRTTLASTDEGILMIGQEGQVLSANQRFVELWRVPEELIATGRDDVMMEHVLGQLSDPDAFVSQVQRLYGSDAQARDTLHFKDGRVFARFTRALAFGDQRGRIWCFKDVTDESRTQAELAESLNLFRAVIDNAPLRIFWKDRDLRYSGCNPIFAKDAGLSSEDELIGKCDADMSWHEHADAYNADDRAVMNSGVTKLAYEEKQTTPDGQTIWLRTSKVPLHNVDNQLIGVLGMYEDVTQAKLAASALALSEEKFRKAFVLIPDAMNINRLSDGMYVSVNEGFTKLMGYASEEIVGHTSLEFDIWQRPEDRARMVEALKQNGSISNFESAFRDKAGGIHFASMSAAVIDIDGQAHIISISRDMTDRKKIEAALEAERERFQTILRNASDGVTVMNSEGYLIDVSDSFCAMLGYSRDELIGMHVSQWDCGSTAVEEKMEIIRSQWQSKTRSLFQTCHRRKDGSTYDAEISGIAIDLNGQKVLFNSTRDITERKNTELALQEERHVRDTIVESIPGIFYAIDEDGFLIFWNHNFQRATGRSAEELQHCNAADLFEGEYRAHIMERIQQTFVEGMSDAEADLVSREGLTTRYYLTGRRIEMAGQPILVGSGVDVGPLKAAEQNLRRLNEQLEDRVRQNTADLKASYAKLRDTEFAMDSVGIGIHWVDFDSGRLIHANRFAAGLLGYSQEEMLQRTVSDIDTHFTPAAFREIADRIRQSSFQKFETEQIKCDGSYVPVEMTVYYHAGDGITSPRMISFMQDISDRKRAEQELLEAKATAEVATTAKSAFLANMSHEIRTPLNAITGMTHLIRKSGVNAVQNERLGKIEMAGGHLLEIINSILDLSKIEAGKFTLEEVPLDVGAIMANVVSILSQQALAKKLDIEIDNQLSMNNFVGDPTRLQQGLLNFGSNAIKFSDKGRVTIHVKLLESDTETALLRFEVEDQGIGIDAATLSRLFSAFEQADNTTTRQYGGTGLGLAITKKLAQLMGGDAGATSELGQGSRFWYTARLRLGTQGAIKPAPTTSLQAETILSRDYADRKILLVEDDLFNQEIALIILQEIWPVVDLAEDGLQAVERVKDKCYDLILMDMQMPRMDGLDATRLIRKLPNGIGVPIIALTGNAFVEDRNCCYDAGMNDFLAKPVKPADLLEVILKWIRR